MGGFDVTSVTIADPWYPRVSNIWGPGPKPGGRLTLDQLDDDFLRLAFRSTGHRDRFLLVLPLDGARAPRDIRVR
jgi:hypothetical protein